MHIKRLCAYWRGLDIQSRHWGLCTRPLETQQAPGGSLFHMLKNIYNFFL